MVKKIAVVATKKEYADYLTENVSKYLNRYAHFVSYSIPEVIKQGEIKEDFVLISAFNIFQQVRKVIRPGTEIIVLTLSLSKRQMQIVSEIPAGTRALLVNFDNRSCMHTITSIYNAGYREIELIPYFGEGDYDREIRVAITPNEEHLVPKSIEKVYNLGESAVDLNSLYTIAEKLGVSEEFTANEAKAARQEYYHTDSSLDLLMKKNETMAMNLDVVLKLVNDGIIITDSTNSIYVSNDKAVHLLRNRAAVLDGFNIEEILPELDLDNESPKLIRTGSAALIVTAVKIINDGQVAGHVITVTDFDEQEERQHGMRTKIRGNDFTPRYHFSDILGSSESIQSVIRSARQIARSDASVMITGESGTGKEMFAQSIHNDSTRSRYNFVAVNCSAIPENLLESEMFGYEGGSFTGAKKEGKIGLFELAHRGTIFLDEIGEMPLPLQAKLLRVLEEHSVRRVGSSKNIQIDVRIIAATNEDLEKMVAQGTFREDLYYRLNVLPLHTPPLRERKEDILPILLSFFPRNGKNIRITDAAEKMLLRHSWRGNVRELRNVAEYLISQGKSRIDVDDLPTLRDPNPIEGSVSRMRNGSSMNLIDKFILNEGRDIELYEVVLEFLKKALDNGVRSGRKSMTKQIQQGGALYSEGEVRKCLSKLSGYGFIRAGRGRSGSVITHEGEHLLETIRSLRERGILG